MGTTWSVVLAAKPANIDPAALQKLLQQELDLINRQMSTYNPVSEVSRFNDSRSTHWFPVSPETAQVVELAQKISLLSGGAFDVTVGPLVDLWGFGPKPRSDKRPSDNEIEAALSQAGYRHLHVRSSPAALRKEIPGLRIDLSAIAKGYAADRLAEILAGKGVADMLVEIGGEMLIKGKNQAGKPWRVAVEKPRAGERGIEKLFHLTDTAMATSGNYRNFFELEGRRFSHVIDPVSGYPVAQPPVSVSVLAPNVALADAWATAFMVLDEARGLELAELNQLAVYWVYQDAGARRTRHSSRMQPYLAAPAA